MFYDAIIVLGQYMPGGEPSGELIARVKAAAQCWIDGYAPAVITCGGQREDELFPEAEWMARALTASGLPVSAVHPETLSMNTEQNLRNAKAMIDGWGGSSAIVVTSDTHMKRALAVCRDIGLPAKGVPVKTSGGRSVKARAMETLGWLEYKLGLQREGAGGTLSRWVRKATRT